MSHAIVPRIPVIATPQYYFRQGYLNAVVVAREYQKAPDKPAYHRALRVAMDDAVVEMSSGGTPEGKYGAWCGGFTLGMTDVGLAFLARHP